MSWMRKPELNFDTFGAAISISISKDSNLALFTGIFIKPLLTGKFHYAHLLSLLPQSMSEQRHPVLVSNSPRGIDERD